MRHIPHHVHVLGKHLADALGQRARDLRGGKASATFVRDPHGVHWIRRLSGGCPGAPGSRLPAL